MCGVDNAIGGNVGHVSHHSSCHGGGHVDPRPALLCHLHSWLHPGTVW